MALVYTKQLASNRWLLSENNNLIEFTDDDTDRTILYAEFTVGTDSPIRIYADPDGKVSYNVKQNVSARLRDYADTLDFSSVSVADLDTFFMNWDKINLNYAVNVNVVFTNNETLTDSYNVNFLLGYENVIDRQRDRDWETHRAKI